MLTSIQSFSPEDAAALNEYCHSHSTPLSSLFTEHQAWTAEIGVSPNWMSSPLQAQLFQFLASDRRAQSVLDLGSFTGYSALAWKEGMRPWGGEVWTVEIDSSMIEACQVAFRKYDAEQKIHLLEGAALDILNNFHDLQFDIIFIDALKKEYIDYFMAILNRNLLKPNGIMLVDDTIHRGLVTNPSETNVFPGPDQCAHLALAQDVHRFNEFVRQDPRVDVVQLPIFNGLTLIKWRQSMSKEP